jgi:LPS-assembly lipoprotein
MRKTALALVVLTAAGLSGCGFTPLYATPGLSSNLSAVEFVTSEGRVGEVLREQFGDAFGRDPSTPARYTLRTQVSENRYPRGARIDNIANRFELNLQVRYQLADKATGAQVTQGFAESTVSYSSADQPYAGIAAQQDAEMRAAADVAKKIQLDLAAWLARRS